MDDIGRQLAEAFAGELAEHLAAIRAALAAAEAGGTPDMRDAFRRAHSLKGAARAVDRGDVEGVAHALESLLADVEAGARGLVAAADDVRGFLDLIEDMAGPSVPVPVPADDGGAARAPEAEAGTLRLAASRVEQLADEARGVQGALDARGGAADALADARAAIDAARAACREPGAHVDAIARRLDGLLAALAGAEARARAADALVERAAADLGHAAEAILLAPAAALAEGQERAVRQLAADAGREAALVVHHDGIEADRRVIQALRDPLTHMLRNAIGHGVEPPAERVAAGKPARATVTLELRGEGGRLLLAVEDDGRGPDVAAIRAAAAARGVGGDAAADEAAALALVFAHGVSTRAGVDRLAGRGVGLSVVADAARRLHGTATMRRAGTGGTRVELVVPLTLTRRAALLVEAGGARYAIPADAAPRVLRARASAIETRSGAAMLIEGAGQGVGTERPLPLLSLAALLGGAAAPLGDAIEAFVLRVGAAEWAVAVDALLDVRPLALADAAEVAADTGGLLLGVAVGEEGRPVLALSPGALAARAAAGGAGVAAPAVPERPRTVLVVDDSITTRTLERGILEGHGYRVLLAVDGLDGLARLRAGRGEIDLVIADVEMPRLDGFGLLIEIRNDPGLADIPVVMMTSRSSPDDIRRGLELGADAYVAKQAFDQGSLLAAVGRLV